MCDSQHRKLDLKLSVQVTMKGGTLRAVQNLNYIQSGGGGSLAAGQCLVMKLNAPSSACRVRALCV